jgi:hypothetical protein
MSVVGTSHQQAPGTVPAPATAATNPAAPAVKQLCIYGHSGFIYWWPVWLVGFLMALLTYLDPQARHLQIDPNGPPVWIHHSKDVGLIYAVVFFLVILVTNVMARGMASVAVVLAILFLTVLFAYLDWWKYVYQVLPHLALYMNLGFYLFFSSLLFVVWFLTVFVHDRLTYWVVRPGQITEDHVIGGAQKSYDTRGMVFEKERQDLFRQWILGLGAADLRIATTGARREELVVPNVFFVDWKV